jgi:hypothetical protein
MKVKRTAHHALVVWPFRDLMQGWCVPTRPIARRVLAAIFVAHVVASGFAIRPSALWTGEPFYTDDHALHFARAAVVAEELRRTGRLWAYDTGTLAGYPVGATVFDLDNVGTAVVMALLPLPPPLAYKLIVLAGLLSAPLVLFAAARRLGCDDAEAVAAAAAAVVVAAMAFTVRLGMAANFTVSHLAVLVVALAALHLRAPTRRSFLALVAAGAVGLLVHVFLGVLVLVPCLILVAGEAWNAPRRTLLQAAAVTVALLALASPWLVPVLHFAPVLGWDYPHHFFQSGPLAGAWRPLTVLWGWPIFLLAAGGVGIGVWARRAPRPVVVAYGAWVLALLVGTLQGSRLPLVSRFEPLHLMLPLSVALCPLAATGLVGVLRALPAPRLIAFVPLAFLPYLVATLVRLAPLAPVSAALPPEGWELVAWLRELTDPGTRLLVEDRLHLERPRLDRDVPDHPYFGGHLLAMLPALTQRQVLSGPYPEMPIRPHRADLSSGIFLGTSLADWPTERLAAALARYNVGTIVVWSSVARERLAAAPEVVTPAGRRGVFAAYRTRQTPSFVLVGSGAVHGRPNALEVTDASPGGVVLKYHWYPGMCSDPALPVGPHDAPDLAMPFIAVDNGDARAFTIRPARDWLGRCR